MSLFRNISTIVEILRKAESLPLGAETTVKGVRIGGMEFTFVIKRVK